LKLQHSGKPTWLTGLTFPNASALIGEVVHFRKRAIRRLGRDLAIDLKELQPIAALLRRALAADRYLAATERSEITQIVLEQQERISACDARITSKHALLFPEVTEALKAFVPELVLFSKGPGVVLGERNAAFVQEEWHRWKPFFDTCERTPLTDEQGKASITMEEATLLVAAAGSGKTSTVVGKVAYMLAKGLATPGEILCLAFNSGAAKEIGERLKERLTFIVSDACHLDEHFKVGLGKAIGSGSEVASKTFHSFGLSVIRRVEGSEPQVVQGAARKRLLADTIQDCRQNPSFAEKWWLLQTVYRFAEPSESRFQSEAEYEEYLRAVLRERSQVRVLDRTGHRAG
jgi:DNA helicase-4